MWHGAGPRLLDPGGVERVDVGMNNLERVRAWIPQKSPGKSGGCADAPSLCVDLDLLGPPCSKFIQQSLAFSTASLEGVGYQTGEQTAYACCSYGSPSGADFGNPTLQTPQPLAARALQTVCSKNLQILFAVSLQVSDDGSKMDQL